MNTPIGVPKPLRRLRPISERLWAKVTKSAEPDGCWEWTARSGINGYGILGRGRRGEGHVTAHRASWEIHHGPIPDGMLVLHRCDNRRCVRPDHLFLGDASAKNREMASSGRAGARARPDHWPRGTEVYNARLTEEMVKEMRGAPQDFAARLKGRPEHGFCPPDAAQRTSR